MVRLEVIVGARSSAEFERFRSDLTAVHCLEVAPQDWVRAEEIGFALGRVGRRVIAADLTIASVAMGRRVPLWHADSDFERIRQAAPELKTFWHPKQAPPL